MGMMVLHHAGKGSIASKLLGERIGKAHAVLMSWLGLWPFYCRYVLCETCAARRFARPACPFENEILKLICVCTHLILCCLWGPTLHSPTTKQLAKMAGCYYYVVLLHLGLPLFS